MKVLICYYSTYGNVYKMANLVAEGVSQVAGAEPVIRTVPELIPSTVIDSRPDMKGGRELQKDVPWSRRKTFARPVPLPSARPPALETCRPSSRTRLTSSRRCG
jgi:NAD(P)H dehydrogenase (quinone)